MPNGSGAKILIVEDDKLTMRFMVDAFDIFGHSTLKSGNGEDALRVAYRELPDLIVTDIRLPGMSGFELVKNLKDDPVFRDIPVLVITALAMPEDKAKIYQSGADAYFAKPVSIHAVMRVVAELLSRKSK